MSELSWPERLFHVRYSRYVMLLEKWFAVAILCLLFIIGVPLAAILVIGAMFFGHYLMVHSNHYHLEEQGGLPVQRVTVAF